MIKRKHLFCAVVVLTVSQSLQAATLFTETFDTYSAGNLVGQGPWAQNGTSSTTPIQVGSGRALLGTSGQDVNAALPSPLTLTDGISFYIGTTLNLSSAQTAGDYFLHWSPATSSTIFVSRLFAKSSGSGYVLGYVETAGTGASLTYGTTELSFNQDYRVIIAYNAITGADTANVYVNPIDLSVESNNSPYLTDAWTSALAETTTVGAVNLRQGSSVNAPSLSVDDLVVATTFSEATVIVPEPTIVSLVGLGLAGLLILRRRG